MNLIYGTHNKNKVKEIKEILDLKNYNIYSLDDINFKDDFIESGNTFRENSEIKALAIYEFIKQKNMFDIFLVMSEDSGLCIEYLNGAPGIHSATYAGNDRDQNKMINKVLNELKGVSFDKRNAYFISDIAIVDHNKKIFHAEGRCFGRISFESKGNNGFGYDPIFLPEEYNYEKTFGELSLEEKNKISHRYIALKKIKEYLEKNYG